MLLERQVSRTCWCRSSSLLSRRSRIPRCREVAEMTMLVVLDLIGPLSCSLDSGDAKDKKTQLRGDTQTNAAYIIKVELLAAKNLIGANLNRTSDPYAIVNYGSEKRFSSMVPGSRNPMWGEEFNFPTDELPVKAELRERTEQYSQLWHGCQRQFTEMERLHWHTVLLLQFQLANVRERGDPKTNSNDASQIIQNIGNRFEAHGNSSENVNVNVPFKWKKRR